MEFYKWRDTENFTNFYKNIKRRIDLFDTRTATLPMNAKIKLHGSNTSIVYKDGKVYAQKRTSVLLPEDDMFGFANWVKDNANPAFPGLNIAVYGEWFGPGIQKGFEKVPQKMFYIFAIVNLEDDTIYLEPEEIQDFVDEHSIPGIVLPWFYENDLPLNVLDSDSTNDIIDCINEDVEKIGELDPYIKEIYGVEVKGEGLVIFNRDSYFREDPILMFKAKCEEHRVSKTKKAMQVDVEKHNKATTLAMSLVAKPRLDQGFELMLQEIPEPDMKDIPWFLKWVAGDVQKECQLEMSENSFEWKDIAKGVNAVAVNYYKNRVQISKIG